MAQKYAKDQPKGFTNRIDRVAIVGASGHIGSHFAKELRATRKHIVTAIVRKGSQSTVPNGINTAHIDYEDDESIVSALKGQQFLLICLPALCPPGTQDKLLNAASKAGVQWVMPNGYTVNVANKALAQDLAPFPGIDAGIKAVESAGPDSSRIALVCSFWYDFCIAQDPRRLGIDVANKKVTMFDDGKTRINVSTLPQCGRAVAKLLSLKELPEDESDTSPTISKWRNQPLYISSCLVSQRDILDSINRVKGITNTDWQIEYQTSESRYKQGLEKIQAGDYMTGMGYVLYGRTFYPNGDGNYENIPGLANGTLGLPEEDIDEATRLGLAAIESGQDLFTAK